MLNNQWIFIRELLNLELYIQRKLYMLVGESTDGDGGLETLREDKISSFISENIILHISKKISNFHRFFLYDVSLYIFHRL